SQWIKRIEQTRGRNKAAVALANKLARIAWALLAQGGDYQPELTTA
ncbi:MAG: IS110 family transposase, partial [Enterobacterales bacterium]|nr:IS110 family transposase [Enterobacterales bacterium]